MSEQASVSPSLGAIQQRAQELQTYDLVTNYRCGSSIEEMERADDGEWVRVEDVRELLSRLAASEAQQPWQPIDTAPKDDDVLLYQEGEGVRAGYWYDLDDEPGWVAVETQGLTGGRIEPTHWMPLPVPPSPATREPT